MTGRKINLKHSGRLKPGQPEEFYQYSPVELLRSWTQNEDILPSLEAFKNNYVLVNISDTAEALVVAAIFMREFNTMPMHVFYDMDDNILYLDMTESMKLGYTIKQCINMLDDLYINDDISSINKDRWGEPLFY